MNTNWKDIILEELEELKFKKFVDGFYTFIKAKGGEPHSYSEENRLHFDKFCKYTNTKINNSVLFGTNPLIGKTFQVLINNKGKSLKDFDYSTVEKSYHVDVDIEVQYAFGRIEKNGTIKAYFDEQAKEIAEWNAFSYDESNGFEVDRDFNYDEYTTNVYVEELKGGTKPLTEDKDEGLETDERVSFYLEYIKNLLPENFNVSESDGQIIIDPPKK
jgi:hypothetical protein